MQKPTTKPNNRALPYNTISGLQKWPDATESQGKVADAQGVMVAMVVMVPVVPGERAEDLGTPRDPKQNRWDFARSWKAKSSSTEDTTLPTQ